MKEGHVAEILQLATYYLINKEDLASIQQKTPHSFSTFPHLVSL